MMEYHTTKSVGIYHTKKQYNHMKKINFAYIWTLDTLHANPDATIFELTKMFTRYKHNSPEIKMVEYQYHQHAIVQAHVAFYRAKRKLNRPYKTLNHSRTLNQRILAKNLACGNTREIVMEKLQTKNLTRSRYHKKYLNRKFLFVRPFAVMQSIKRRCEKQSIVFSQTSPKFTSQKCSACGYTVKENRNGPNSVCVKCNYSDANASLNIAFARLLLAGRHVNEKSVSLFKRHQLNPTWGFFKTSPAQNIGCQTSHSVRFRFFGERRHKVKGGHSLDRGT